MISKQQWFDSVKYFATDGVIREAEMRVAQVTRVRGSFHDLNGMEEDKLLGHDPLLDEMIAKHRANLSAYWTGRASIARYLQEKLEKK